MRRLAALLAVLACLPVSLARAEEPAKPKVDQQNVKLSPVALPIVVDGRVVNYIFVTVQVDLAPFANASALQAKEPEFRDALVRDAHRTPFVLASDFNHIDEAKLKAALMRDSGAIAGPGNVKGVEVLSQTAQRFVPVRKPEPPDAS
jgi:hypothetical protein